MARRKPRLLSWAIRAIRAGTDHLALTTNDGAGLFPNHLHNVNAIVSRANWLLDSRQVRRFVHPEFTISRSFDGAVTLRFVYEEGGELVLDQRFFTGRVQLAYVHKGHLVEALDLLNRVLLLDDLSDI